MGWLNNRLENAKKRRKRDQISNELESIVDNMCFLNERSMPLRKRTADGRVFSGHLEEELPSLQLGEIIIASTTPFDFFTRYVTDEIEGQTSDRYTATVRGFKLLLDAVGRRAPFDDLFADEKEHHVSVSNISEGKGKSPFGLEGGYVEMFEQDILEAIRSTQTFEALRSEVETIFERFVQYLPYKVKSQFFADADESPNFGRLIQEKFAGMKKKELMATSSTDYESEAKRFGIEKRKEIADYVNEVANNPVFTMLRLVTVDAYGMISDRIVSRDNDVLTFNPVDYLQASDHYETTLKAKKAISEKNALAKRLARSQVKKKDIETGIGAYLSKVHDNPNYRIMVNIDDQGTPVITPTDDAQHVVATVVVAQDNFKDYVAGWKKSREKELDKRRTNAAKNGSSIPIKGQISQCDNFHFMPRYLQQTEEPDKRSDISLAALLTGGVAIGTGLALYGISADHDSIAGVGCGVLAMDVLIGLSVSVMRYFKTE